MVDWLVEFGDRTKGSDELKSPEFLAAVGALQNHIAQALSASPEAPDEFNDLQVVFSVDPERDCVSV
jgi:hypothetical protein